METDFSALAAELSVQADFAWAAEAAARYAEAAARTDAMLRHPSAQSALLAG